MIRQVMTMALAGLLAACGADGGAGDGADTPAAPQASAQAGADASEQAVSGKEVVILAFGDSLFAGYGLQDSEGYPEQLQATLRGQGINARVIDAGVSGDTTGAGAQRIAFVLDNQPTKPDLALIGLGGNDLLRGLPVDGARANLEKILLELQDRGIPVLLFGMRAPPNAGPDYVEAFDGLYPQLAETYGAALIPFWLEPVYDQPQLMQADRIHPTARGIDALVAYTEDDVREALPAAD